MQFLFVLRFGLGPAVNVLRCRSMALAVASLPIHRYVWIDTAFTHREPIGFVPAVWFGLVSHPGRVWGCHVLLESGAWYRNLPPHALAFCATPEPSWPVTQAQHWDCYSREFSVVAYDYLVDLPVTARVRKVDYPGRYLFSAAPMGDGFSEVPDQAKEFAFVALDNGRLTIQPTNHLLFADASFTEGHGWPSGLVRQDAIHRVE